MRTIRYILLAIIMLGVVLVAIANRAMVELHLMPDGLAQVFDLVVTLPLFVVILIALLVGVALGYILEWGREMRQRREASEARRTIARLEAEVETLRKKAGTPKNDILAALG